MFEILHASGIEESMEIFNSSGIHEWDTYTIQHEPVSSLALMERAATACFNWLMKNGYRDRRFTIYCGKGNNGGDGLAIARMLAESGHEVVVNILEFGHLGTEDFQANLSALHDTEAIIRFLSTEDNLQSINREDIIIDAIFGSGLNREPVGLNASVINHLNTAGAEIISIDIPSGLSADFSSAQNIKVLAKHTLTFQVLKLAFMMPENEQSCGEIHLLDIGLHPGFPATYSSKNYLVDEKMISRIYKPRKDFGHKGTYGHALMIVGSYGKIGAAVLATKACLRSGTGLCTAHVPACGYQVLQISCPEAMTETDSNNSFNTALEYAPGKYAAVGVGPGLGQETATVDLVRKLISGYDKPLVIDADALNILSSNKDLLERLPPGAILTPHPREFERLFGTTDNNFVRMELAAEQASRLNIIIILKGHYTLVATSQNRYFNSTGNSGMASGGTGDALTGILTGLLAQGYEPEDAAILGVYLHGLAGDITAKSLGKESMLASDLVNCLGEAFLKISTYRY